MGFHIINTRHDIFTTLIVTCLGAAHTIQSTLFFSEKQPTESTQQLLLQQLDSTTQPLESINTGQAPLQQVESDRDQPQSVDIRQLPPLPPFEELMKPHSVQGKPIIPPLPIREQLRPSLSAHQIQEVQQMTDFASNVMKENHKLSERNDIWSKYCATLGEQNQMMKEANEKYPKLNADARSLKQSNGHLKTKNSRLQKQIEDLHDEIRNLKLLSNSSNTAWKQELTAANDQMDYRNDVLQSENEKYDKVNVELRENYNKYSIKVQQLQSTYQATEKENIEVTNEMNQCTQQHEMLKKAKLDAESFVAQTMKLEMDMTTEILELKESTHELENMNIQCQRIQNMQ